MLAALVAAASLAAVVRAPRARGVVQGRPSAVDVPSSRGYWLAAADGGVFGYDLAGFKGSMGGHPLNRLIVGMAPTPSGKGYWLVASDGGIFSFGDARFQGSPADRPWPAPIVGMVASPTGGGYWLAAADGAVLGFGDAVSLGSTAGRALPAPIVAIVPTPGGTGYWLVGAKGHVYPFGDAPFLGDTGGIRLAQPVVGMAAAPGGRGYWLVASDGGVFAFGDARFLGSMGGTPLNSPIVGLAPSPRSLGYWMVAADGGIFSFGDARFAGSTGGSPLNSPVIAMAAAPVRTAPEVAAFYYPWYANPADGAGVWRHWDQGGHVPPVDIGSDFYPTRGAYSSADAAVLDAQLAEIAGAGIDTVVSSWWGRSSYEDFMLEKVKVAAAKHGVRVAVHIEPYNGRTPWSVRDDIAALKGRGYREFWLYDAMGPPASDWRNALASVGAGVRLFMETGSLINQVNGRFAAYAAAAGMDGVYTYAPTRYGASEFGFACGAARQRRLLCSPSVAPGQLDTRTPPLRPYASREYGARYARQWRQAAAAGADVASITSYNEWHEGTQIEPARPYCFPDGVCSAGYEGEYGQTGPAAATAYLTATRSFSDWFRAQRR